ncbi:MAG: COX15/CtaA family protein [Rhodospirillales bacterium]|nr:COX15/CtaA family protein [Rhodospirillales bacterium]
MLNRAYRVRRRGAGGWRERANDRTGRVDPVQYKDNGGARRRERILGSWLLVLAGMVFTMVVLGGLTRLTQSGLSMVEWRPVTGWLPPLSQESWEQAFAAYKAFPEYEKINAGMSLADFKSIFWLEFVHRLWGRLIGLAFAVPFIVFLARRWIDRAFSLKLLGMFVLGGLQGGLGWYMVASGLVDRPDVSQYRLAAHLGMALVIYAYILWVALGLLLPRRAVVLPSRAVAGRAMAITALIFVTIVSGGFVAGLDAGYAYNTFPLMDGELIPAHLLASSPWWRSFFEDVTTVQFTHRLLALTTFSCVLAQFVWSRRPGTTAEVRRASAALAGWVCVQVGLGIATLLSIVALPLAAMHQASALVLWTLALWTSFEALGRPAAGSAAGSADARKRASAPGRATASGPAHITGQTKEIAL